MHSLEIWRWTWGWGISCYFRGCFWCCVWLWNIVFSPLRSGPVSNPQICGWWECQWLLDTRYLILDFICTDIFLDSVVPMAASWFSTSLVGTGVKASLVGQFCSALSTMLGDLAYSPVQQSFHQFPEHLIPTIKSCSALNPYGGLCFL